MEIYYVTKTTFQINGVRRIELQSRKKSDVNYLQF